MEQDTQSQKNIMLIGAIFEGGMAIVAVGLGWIVGQSPMATLHFDWNDLWLALAATLPPLGIFWFGLKSSWRPFTGIRRVLDETVIPMFQHCSLLELALISILAGLGEEMLFRGVIQPAIASGFGDPSGVYVGLLAAAMLFGLLHAMTPTYAAVAGIIGLYLGGIWLWCNNLMTPIVIHSVYDFVVLAYLVKVRSRQMS
jgi:uncharacterized protein